MCGCGGDSSFLRLGRIGRLEGMEVIPVVVVQAVLVHPILSVWRPIRESLDPLVREKDQHNVIQESQEVAYRVSGKMLH